MGREGQSKGYKGFCVTMGLQLQICQNLPNCMFQILTPSNKMLSKKFTSV